MALILVVGPDEGELAQLVQHLGAAGHEVTAARGGVRALALLQQLKPDLVALDLGITDVPGTELCRRIRTEPAYAALPIVMLSERRTEIDRVVAFEVGADDFITKPFSYRELTLRVRAILRRRSRPSKLQEVAHVGGLELDTAGHRATVDGREVALSALEFKLLATLFSKRNRVQSRSRLLDEVWGGEENVGLRTVDACIKRLRHKLGRAGRLIQTVRGVGYRFISGDQVRPPVP